METPEDIAELFERIKMNKSAYQIGKTKVGILDVTFIENESNVTVEKYRLLQIQNACVVVTVRHNTV